MPDSKFLAINTNDLPWEERYNEKVGRALFRKELFSDPDTGMMVRLVRYPAGVINPHHTHPCGHGMYVLEGQLVTHRGTYGPGSFVWFPEGEVMEHGASPAGDVTVVFITNKPFRIDYVAPDGRAVSEPRQERSLVQATAGGESVQAWYRTSRRAAAAGLVVTLLLGLLKLVGGWFGHSLALLSDSVHSLGDALASASILAALWWAEQPADHEHPYGHARIESIAASSIALLLILSAAWIVWEAVHTWSEPKVTPHGYTLAIALVSAVLNEAIYRYSARVAAQTGSQSLRAAAWDQRLDVFGSLVVLVGLMATLWGGPDWHFVDHAAALVVAAIICWAGGKLYWASLQDLMDRQAGPELLQTIRDLASGVPGVRGLDKVYARKAGMEYLVDIHVEVAPETSVREGHRIGHAVKNRLVSDIVAVKDVLVHIEPSRL